jgi:hypothetical protein
MGINGEGETDRTTNCPVILRRSFFDLTNVGSTIGEKLSDVCLTQSLEDRVLDVSDDGSDNRCSKSCTCGNGRIHSGGEYVQA